MGTLLSKELSYDRLRGLKPPFFAVFLTAVWQAPKKALRLGQIDCERLCRSALPWQSSGRAEAMVDIAGTRCRILLLAALAGCSKVAEAETIVVGVNAPFSATPFSAPSGYSVSATPATGINLSEQNPSVIFFSQHWSGGRQ